MRGLAVECLDSLIAGPTLLPIDLEEVKKQRRFTSTSLDTLFDLWINAATQEFEEETGVQLITATWEYWLNAVPSQRQIELPHPPLQSVTSLTYDTAEGEQTLDTSAYRVVAPSGPYPRRGYLELVNGASWPSLQPQAASVRIRFQAGFGDAPGAVPERFKHALLMLIGHFHKYGEEVSEARANILQLPMAAQMIMTSAKRYALPQLEPLTYGPGSQAVVWRT